MKHARNVTDMNMKIIVCDISYLVSTGGFIIDFKSASFI